MKKILMATVAMLIGGSAFAADLRIPLKAAVAPVVQCSIDYCVSWYAGLGIIGAGSNLNVFGNGLNGSLNANGTLMDVHAGYRMWNGKFYLGGEIAGTYDMAGGTTGLGMSFSDRLAGMELVKVGGSLNALLGNQQPIVFPAALAPYLMSLYGIMGAKQRMGANGIVGGAGAEFVITPNTTINLEYLNVKYNGGGASDVAGLAVSDENLARMTFNYNF